MYLIKNNKSPFYQVIYFIGKRRTTVSTKTADMKEAETFLEWFRNQLEDPNIPVQAKLQPVSLIKFKKEYVSYLEGSKSPHYIRSIKLSFKMLIEFSGDIKLHHLDLRTLDKFINTTYCKSPAAAVLYYRTLKAAFSKAVIWNYLPENPLKRIKAPKVAKVYPAFISVSELHKILDQTPNEQHKNIFLTAFYTGMRLGEILNMKWNWIDVNKNIITVKCSAYFKTKSKKERIIPISSAILKIFLIKEINQKMILFFPNV
jgi:integrase